MFPNKQPEPLEEYPPEDDSWWMEEEIIADLAKRATDNGMVFEVIKTFGEFRASGNSVEEAARCTIREWDL